MGVRGEWLAQGLGSGFWGPALNIVEFRISA